jgi:hypothetical protein
MTPFAWAAAALVLSAKRTMSGHCTAVRMYWTVIGNSDKIFAGRKGGHL